MDRFRILIFLIPLVSGKNIFDLKNIGNSEEINNECLVQLKSYAEGLNNFEAWAWNMFDASSKIPVGMFEGNRNLLGNFPQCLRVEYKNSDGVEIYGKHCLGAFTSTIPKIVDQETTLKNNPMFEILTNKSLERSTIKDDNNEIIKFSICIPNECKPSEVVDLISIGFDGILASDLQPNDDALCQSELTMEGFSNVDLAFVIFFGVIILLNIVCSIYDVMMTKKGKEPSPWLLLFSFGRNFRELHEFPENPNRIACLDGLRVFSVLWIILGTRFTASQALPHVNSNDVSVWQNRMYSQYGQGSGIAIDTFLFLSGLSAAMQFLKTQSRPNAKFNIILFWIQRYIRITPTLGVLYFLHVSVFTHFGSGPFWPSFVFDIREKCLDRWISFFFYHQNYLDSDGICLPHTWYLSTDMQIFVVSPIILFPLVKFRKAMLKVILPFLLAASVVAPFVIAYVYETQIFTKDYYDYYYYPLHTRLAVWIIGIITGTLILEYRNAHLDIHWALNLFIWVCVVVGMVGCVFLGNDVIYDYNRVNTAFYLAFHRPAWALGLSWAVFSCMKGKGGIFQAVLGLGIFQYLSRLTYSMYLVHVSSLLLSVAKVHTEGEFSDFEVIHMFLGDLLQVTPIALIWYILFESPMVVLDKILFGVKKRVQPRINGANRTAPTKAAP